MAMTWRRGWLLAAAASLISCGAPYPCEKDVKLQDPVILAGSAKARVTCASGAQQLTNTSLEYRDRQGTVDTTIDVLFSSEVGVGVDGPRFFIEIPRELADGTYAMEGATPPIKVYSPGEDLSQLRGTISFQRTHNVPFIDQEAPPEGEVTSSLLLTLDLQGSYGYTGDCGQGTFGVGPVTIQFERSAKVDTCRDEVHLGGGH